MSENTTDAALFAALAQGEHHALDALYERHAPTLFALAVRATGDDRTRAEDLLHDVFVDVTHHARTPGVTCSNVLRWLVLRLFQRAR